MSDQTFDQYLGLNPIHSKKCWVILTKFWVKYGQTQPLGYIFKLYFNPIGWVCPYFTQNWVKTTQHFLECSSSQKHSQCCVRQLYVH